MSIYKYVSEFVALRYLKSWHLKYSSYRELDDAFEMSPSTDYEGIDIGLISPEQYKKNQGDMRKGIPDVPHYRQSMQWIHTKLVEDLREMVGVLCFTRNGNSAEMWGKYADSGRGIMFEFDEGHPAFNRITTAHGDGFGVVRPVNYVAERPVLTPMHISKFTDILFMTKGESWMNQQESRLLWPLSHPDQVTFDSDKGINHNLYQIPKSALRSVVLGYKSTSVEAFREVLRSQVRCRHIALKKAASHSRDFSFIYNDAT